MLSELIHNYFLSFLSALVLYLGAGICFGSYLMYKDDVKRTRGEIILIVIGALIWPITMFVYWVGQWILDGIDIT